MKLTSLLSVLLLALLAQGPATPTPLTSYDVLYESLRDLKPDTARVADIRGLELVRDVALFRLEEGTLTACEPVRDRVCGMVFLGKGSFRFSPPTRVEREHLFRFFEGETLDVAFDRLVLIFADTTLHDLERRITFQEGKPPPDALGELESCLDYITYKKTRHIHDGIARALLNDETNSVFFAKIETSDIGTVFFEVDPRRHEEIRFMRRPKGEAWFRHNLETINQFHKSEDYGHPQRTHWGGADRLGIRHYDMDVKLEKDLDLWVAADMTLESFLGREDWIRLRLAPKIEVDSVRWAGEKVEAFAKGEENPDLWIRLDPPLAEGEQGQLTLHYHGDVMTRAGDDVYLTSPTTWYPRIGTNTRSTFDMRFHIPERYDFQCAGEKISEEKREGHRHSQWIVEAPCTHVSFNLGFFKKHEIKDERIPPVTILMSKTGHRDIKEALIQEGVASGRHMERQVGADVANAVAFFQNIFGPCPSKTICATEIPYAHGQAFPGMIHLAWTTFQRTDEEGYDAIFRAHEVAHQWWGLGVDADTYHDQWLVEGIADYLGLWYMQAALQDNSKFFNVLNEWKSAILENRKYTFGSGQEAGPIWLGQRTSTSTTKGDYGLIVYKKGAWVLHMLRNMMLDLNTMSEDAFLAMMKDFYLSFTGLQASTQDFRNTIEEHFGMDMGWFFDQWVYGSDIPTYEVSYKITEAAEGQFKTTMRVVQRDVPPSFRMYVPIHVRFSNDQFTKLRTHIVGREVKFDLPLLPMEPQEIVFNDMESVLCRVEEVNWED